MACMGEMTGVYRALVGKPEGKRPHGRLRYRWEDNIKMIFGKWDVGTYTGLIWLRIGTGGVGTCECGNEPSYSIKCREFRD